MEHLNDNVIIGREVHAESYQGDKKELKIDETIVIDRIDSDGIIHETKKSKYQENAHVWQMKFYLWYLLQKGVESRKGVISYPLIKKTQEVLLTEEDIEAIESIIRDIESIQMKETPPVVERMKICKNCSYEELCWI